MVISDVSMIESVGGGSCRCLLVENWSTVDTSALPKAKREGLRDVKKFLSIISDCEDNSSCDDSKNPVTPSPAYFATPSKALKNHSQNIRKSERINKKEFLKTQMSKATSTSRVRSAQSNSLDGSGSDVVDNTKCTSWGSPSSVDLCLKQK
jgi:hypothetical protein